jgi:hypothetical protein
MQCFRLFSRAVLGAAIAGSLLVSVLPASAALYSPRQALPSQTIQQFLSNPASLLALSGPQLIAMVRDLAASDPGTLNAIIGLLSSANPDQSTAIGTALGQVALMAAGTDPSYATQIQDAVATSKNTSALVAFSAVVGGDIKITAATGGVGGGGGGAGPTGDNGISGGFFAGTGANFRTSNPNTPDNFNTTTFGGGSPGSPNVSQSQ